MEKTLIKNEPSKNTTIKNSLQLKRIGKANWIGDLKEGKGTINSGTGVVEKVNYSYKTRFKDGKKGTNPEELLAMAHAACFTMSVSSILTEKGYYPTTLDTIATVYLEDFSITKIHLSITGSVKKITSDEFSKVVKEAEVNCIISRALKVPISSESFLTEY